MKDKPFKKGTARADFTESLKAAAPVALFAALYLLVFSSFPALGAFFKNSGYTQYFYNYTNAYFSPYTALLTVGVCTAYSLFRFLYSAPQTNVILSSGLTRTQLFWNRFLAGAVTLSLSVLVPLTATLFVNAGFHSTGRDTVKTYLLFCVSAMTLTLLGFSVGLLSAMLSGTVPKAAALAATILYFPALLLEYAYTNFAAFLKGYDVYGSYFHNWDTASALISPLSMLSDPGANDYASGQSSLWESHAYSQTGTAIPSPARDLSFGRYLPFIVWICVALLLAGVAALLFSRRKAERNGRKTGTKTAAALMTSFAVLVPYIGRMLMHRYDAGNSAGYDAYRALSLSGKTEFWSGNLLFSLVVLCVCLWIVTRNGGRFLRRLTLLPLVLLLAVFPTLCLNGFFGATSYIPDPKDIKSVSVEGFLEFAGLESDQTGTLTGFTSEKDKALVAALQKHLIEAENTDRSVPVRIIYTLKDGGTVSRYYSLCSGESLKASAALFDSDAVETYIHNRFGDKSSWLPEKETQEMLDNHMALTFDIRQPLWAQWLCYGGAEVTLRGLFSTKETDITNALTEKEFDALLSCYAEDLVDMTVDEYATPEKQPVGILTFTLPKDEEGYQPKCFYTVGASMTRTRAFLKAHGLDTALSLTDDITQITFYKNNCIFSQPFSYEMSEESVYIIRPATDPSEIKTVMKTLYPYYLITDGAVTTATVEYKNGESDSFVVKAP